MNPAIIIGAAVALAVSFGKRRGPSSRSRLCSPLSFGGDSLAGYDYLEFVTGGASSKDRLPIVILLHGRGGSPELLFEHVRNIPSRARIILPRGHLGTKSNPLWFELRAATEDQETLANQMAQEADSLARFVEEINLCLKGRGKPVLAGRPRDGCPFHFGRPHCLRPSSRTASMILLLILPEPQILLVEQVLQGCLLSLFQLKVTAMD